MVGIDAKVEVLSGWNLCMSSAHIPKEARRASWPHKALPVSKGAVILVLCYGLLVWKVESEFLTLGAGVLCACSIHSKGM